MTAPEPRLTWRERARVEWSRLRGGALTPVRAALSVGVGVAIGVTPLWGLHWAIVLAVCLPFRLDATVAWLATNVSLPFFAPFVTFAEISLGARVLHGAWPKFGLAELRGVRPADVAAELAVGTLLLAPAAAAALGGVVYVLTSLRRRNRRSAS